MADEKITLCGANSYEEKYYFNPEFELLPTDIQNKLQAICVLFTEEVGGIMYLEFDKVGNLLINIASDEKDYLYDTIEAELQVRKVLEENEELFSKLELYYTARKSIKNENQ